jgi:hypothetical protein
VEDLLGVAAVLVAIYHHRVEDLLGVAAVLVAIYHHRVAWVGCCTAASD